MATIFSSDSPIKRLLGSVWSLAAARIELASLELHEEKSRIFSAFFLGLIALLFGMMAFITLTILIVLAFWDTYFWQILSGLIVFYALIALCCAKGACTRIHKAPLMFEATQAEFKKDKESMDFLND